MCPAAGHCFERERVRERGTALSQRKLISHALGVRRRIAISDVRLHLPISKIAEYKIRRCRSTLFDSSSLVPVYTHTGDTGFGNVSGRSNRQHEGITFELLLRKSFTNCGYCGTVFIVFFFFFFCRIKISSRKVDCRHWNYRNGQNDQFIIFVRNSVYF